MTRYNLQADLHLTRMRITLVKGVRTSVYRAASEKIANQMFEVALDTVLPLGELNDAGRDPDNLRRAK